jgi:hypothetical protein
MPPALVSEPSADPVGAEPVAGLPEIKPEAQPDPAPSEAPNEASGEATATVTIAVVAGTGIPICDEYLALYARCEQFLMPEIMAGNRRFHHAEEAALQFQAGTSAAASLPSACQNMIDALRVDCPEQHRQP